LTEAAPAKRCVAVAFSGGRDSTALLHVTARAAVELGLDVVALHVHHGLVAQADDWLAHCRRLCARWSRAGMPIRLLWRKLSGSPARGDSIEAWARRERYLALAKMANEAGADIVLLAHHRLDQAETVVLQALRGGGVKGLAAMPQTVVRDRLTWSRPWLAIDPALIAAHVLRHQLSHIVDTSNDDQAFARNRLRAAVWPHWRAAFPELQARLAQVARHMHEADLVLSEVAAADLASIIEPDAAIRIAAWSGLTIARRANVLRHWLAKRLDRGPPETLIGRLLAEVPQVLSSACWPIDAGRECRLYRGRLEVVAISIRRLQPTQQSFLVDLSRVGWHHVAPWAGGFEVAAVAEKGLAVADVRCVELRPRCGGEQFQVGSATIPRSLKKQFQALAIADADRAGPLVYNGDRLVFVPHLGIDARSWACAGQAQIGLRWIADE
jgi:tRNA(Ile)-lysidine synthase